MDMSSSVTERASSGKPVDMRDAAQARNRVWLDVQLQQAEHLRVAVLLDHVNPVVLLTKS